MAQHGSTLLCVCLHAVFKWIFYSWLSFPSSFQMQKTCPGFHSPLGGERVIFDAGWSLVFVCVWAGGRAGESFKQRPQKQMSQPAMGGSEPMEGGRLRGSQSSEGSDLIQSPGIITSPPFSSPYSSPSEPSGRDTEFSEFWISGDPNDHCPLTVFHSVLWSCNVKLW